MQYKYNKRGIVHCTRLAGGNNLMQHYLCDAHECGFSFYLRNWMAFKMKHKTANPQPDTLKEANPLFYVKEKTWMKVFCRKKQLLIYNIRVLYFCKTVYIEVYILSEKV